MKPTQLLKKQHDAVKALFKKIEKAKPDQRRPLLAELAGNLQLHMKIEEGVFYPAVKELGTKKAQEMISEAYEEHHVVKLVIAEIPKVDPQDERFEAKVTVLKELIEHHVEEEEDEMFEMAEKLDDDVLKEVGERMMAEVERAKGRAA